MLQFEQLGASPENCNHYIKSCYHEHNIKVTIKFKLFMEIIGHFGAVHKAHLIRRNTSDQSHMFVAAKMIR